MIDLNLEVYGDTAMIAALGKLEHMDDILARELAEWGSEVVDGQLYGMSHYPAPPPDSTYIRTGNLAGGWGLQREGKSAIKIYNMTPYAGYVVGDNNADWQARIHAGRWWLARKRVEEALPRFIERIRDAINKL